MDTDHGRVLGPRCAGALLAAVAVVISIASCTGIPSESKPAGGWDENAVDTCQLLFGGAMQEDLAGAVDSTVGQVKEISVTNGLNPDDDPNLVGAADSVYAALCLVPVDGKRYVFYQLEDGARSGAISYY